MFDSVPSWARHVPGFEVGAQWGWKIISPQGSFWAQCILSHPELTWHWSSSNFDSLNEDDAVENNQLAFDVAKREFGILPVTTGKEMASTQEPDKLSMVMYLSKFYELFRGTPLRPMGKHRGCV